VSKMAVHLRWIRIILDCLLGLAVILGIFTYSQPKTAIAEQKLQPQEEITGSLQDNQQQITVTAPLTNTEIISASSIEENETIAAIIAVENAALTPPDYLQSLPIISR
jgi:hypothetical protein